MNFQSNVFIWVQKLFVMVGFGSSFPVLRTVHNSSFFRSVPIPLPFASSRCLMLFARSFLVALGAELSSLSIIFLVTWYINVPITRHLCVAALSICIVFPSSLFIVPVANSFLLCSIFWGVSWFVSVFNTLLSFFFFLICYWFLLSFLIILSIILNCRLNTRSLKE